jgi:CIC family chloride channel protein
MSGRNEAPDSLYLRWRRINRNDQVVLAVLAAVIGTAVAYGAIGFREFLAIVQDIGFGFTTEDVFTQVGRLAWWKVILVPTLGGLVVGTFVHLFMPGRRPQGVANVIEAGALHGGRMSLTLGLRAAVVNAASLGVGASAGREGPLVHLGGAIAAYITKRAHLNPSLALTLLGCGVASGVAASFNAPIAGVFFALEVVIGHYALHAFAPIVIAAVAGTIVSRIHLGLFPAFVVPNYDIGSFYEFPAFVLLGLLSAGVAIIFMRSIIATEEFVNRTRTPVWIRPAAAGLIIGIIALWLPQVLGVGYEATDAALNGSFGIWLLIGLVLAKTAATAVSLGCRFGGGVFSPSLYIGAMMGGAFGIIAAKVFPELASSPGFYSMIAMGAVAAPVIGAPMSTILIAFELTGEFAVTLAAMIAIAVSSLVTQQAFGRSFFHWQLERRGLRLRAGRIDHLLQSSHVGEIMSSEFEVIPRDAPVAKIRQIVQTSAYGDFMVIGDDGEFVGSLTFADLKGVAFDDEYDNLVKANDIARTKTPVLYANDTLEGALKVMDGSGEDVLPVVEDAEGKKVIGIVHHKAALAAYNRALLQARAEEHDEAQG